MRPRARKVLVRPAGGPSAEINVTPLVDVVLVLLIIFMVVTPLLEKDIGVRTPAAEQVENVSQVPPDQLLVSVSAEGGVLLNSEPVAESEYVERLSKLLAGRPGADRVVFFAADDRASYARVVAVLDGAKKAGATTLGMMTDAPNE